MQLGNSQVLARYQLGTTSKKRGIIIFFGYGFVPIFQVVLWPHSFSHFLSFSSFYHLINSLFFLYFTFVDLSSFSCFQYSLFSSLYIGFSRFFLFCSLSNFLPSCRLLSFFLLIIKRRDVNILVTYVHLHIQYAHRNNICTMYFKSTRCSQNICLVTEFSTLPDRGTTVQRISELFESTADHQSESDRKYTSLTISSYLMGHKHLLSLRHRAMGRMGQQKERRCYQQTRIIQRCIDTVIRDGLAGYFQALEAPYAVSARERRSR